MRAFTIRLTDQEYDALKSFAQRTGVSMTELVRGAIAASIPAIAASTPKPIDGRTQRWTPVNG